jgi:hypothetical protein
MTAPTTLALTVMAVVATAALELSRRPLADKLGVNYIVYGLTH